MGKDVSKSENQKNLLNYNMGKIMSYLVIIVIGFVFFYFCLFNVIPYINLVGINFSGNNMGKIMMYYPSFLMLDCIVFFIAYKIVRIFSKGVISFFDERFCKK